MTTDTAARLRAVMPDESPLDLDAHAAAIARTVERSRDARLQLSGAAGVSAPSADSRAQDWRVRVSASELSIHLHARAQQLASRNGAAGLQQEGSIA